MTENMMDHPDLVEEHGLLFACVLDGKGGATFLGWDDMRNWTEADGPLWIHMNTKNPRVADWLRTESGLTLPTAEAMLASETRPRVFRGKRGVVAILRGVNLNEGANIEDMVAMRMWSEGIRVITLRHERMHTPRDILEQLIELNTGPKTAPELFEKLTARVNEHMARTIEALEDELDELESDLDMSMAQVQRRELSNIRQKAVVLRRYIAPQREALGTLVSDPPHWIDENLRPHIRETYDRLMRYIEELDTTRERAMVVKDDIANRLAESSNRTLYMLAIVSAVFLPLGFLTGLLGINVGGMPGVESGFAFWVFCFLLGICFIGEIAVLKRLKWL